MFLAYERIRKVGRVPIKKVGCALALRNLQDIGSITHGSPCSPGVPRILWKHVRFHHSQNKKSYWSRIDDKFGCAQESARKVHSIPMLLGLSKLKCDLCRSHNSNGFSVMSASAGMTYHAQAARRRLSLLCCYRGPTFPAISKLARAVSLACVRSHLTPRILVLIIGLASWAHNRWAESEELYPSAPLNSQVNNSHAIFTSSIWSFLEGFILVIRALYLMALFTPAIAMAPLASLFEGRYREIWLQLVQRFLEKAGAAFIKWGQWAATHPNLFPRDLCKELAKLHTKAPAHKFSYTQKTIEKSFGRRIDEIFDDFEEEPVASGSIAQVHKATLTSRYPGQKVKPMIVAVKVRHPGVSEVIQRDFVIINLVAKVSSYLPALRWLRLEESVQQFAIFMLSQVDLSREAAHLNRFLYNFRRWKDVSFPKPLYPLVHPAVLVETYEQGESVAHYVDQPEGNYCINRSLTHTGTHTLLKMLLILGGTHFSQAHLVFYFGYIALPVVGWPPIKSFRRNLAPQPKVAAAPSCNPPAPAADPGEKKINTMFVKVNVDGIPIGRKINLKAYDSYEKLSVALDEMFRGSINGGAARISKRSPDLAGLGVVGTLHKTIVPMTAIGALLLDKSGRRPLLMVFAGGMSIGCFLVGLSFYIQVMEQMHILQPS